MKIPKGWKKVEGASSYALSPEDQIYNLKTGKPISRRWRKGQFWSSLTCDDGKYRQISHNELRYPSCDLPDVEMRVIADYPDYKVTTYGAVWKYRKTPRLYRNNPYLVLTKDFGKKEYVRLTTEDGRRHWVRMEKIMEDTYPEH